jgi:Leucine-rich repeat (LRR) protein
MKVDIRNRGITSLSQIDWSIYLEPVTELYCSNNQITSLECLPNSVEVLDCSLNRLTSLEYCPDFVEVLDCSFNQLTSLKFCPNSVEVLDCYNNQLTSLEYLPNSVEKLYCSGNQLTSLKHCSNSITELYCCSNQLTSLKYCPNSVKALWSWNNPFEDNFKDWKLQRRKDNSLLAINKINTIYRNNKAKLIQKAWRRYWYEDLIAIEENNEKIKVSRFCLYSIKN